jgi:hypothetical protein
MVKISFDPASNSLKFDNKCGRQDVVLEGSCPGTCSGCKDRAQVTDPRVYVGRGAPLDPDKTHAETKKLLNLREEHNQHARPSLQDLFDAERAAREKPVVILERKPSPDEVHVESHRILQTTENLRKMESQEIVEKADKQLVESKKLLETFRRSGSRSTQG